MRLLILSGLLYLAGIAAILYWKPALMFRSDGTWKEFGIGRNPDDYTWLPFWLAAVAWAIISYMTILLLTDSFKDGKHVPVSLDDGYPRKPARNSRQAPLNSKRASNIANIPDRDVLPGYYILNAEGGRKGVPKYIYVGEHPPIDFEGGDGADAAGGDE
jgi:hypothetical protein